MEKLNVGVVGHVDHGKTTLVYSLTGVLTDTHSEEKKRGITIKLGYADAVVYKCNKGHFGTKQKCACGTAAKEEKRISFLDAPGHETLMATVIAASSIMDAALFVVSATEKCPQPQTIEHLMVLEAAGIEKIVICQNKVDLVSKQRALEHFKELKDFLAGSIYENAPIIPVSATTGANMETLLEKLCELPQRNCAEGEPRMYVARSFDVNKPGTPINSLLGGVIGGSIVRGTLKQGDEIEILPGTIRTKKEKETLVPLRATISALRTGGGEKESATCGGLVGASTSLDPSLSRADALVGCVAGKPGTLPPVFNSFALSITPLKRQLESFSPTFTQNEPLVIGVGTSTTLGFVQSAKKGKVELLLKKSICVDKNDKLAIMRRSKNRWHLYATAELIS
ncbi:translation initiation factor IF-2 subunit gamma [Candidatus Micrarchaeota archaeon]|nr:translation initiation factor IF-2 subunit gamma [Candidatus Micrarchaeota archaeon]